MKSSRVEKEQCPTCGHSINAATDVSDENNAPRPGDFTICLYCQDIFKFGQELQMEPLDEADILQLNLDAVLKYQRAIKESKQRPES